MSEQREPLPCPFCGGKCDPSGWMSVGGVTGPECQDCGATAQDVDSWNHRIRPPGEVSEDGEALKRGLEQCNDYLNDPRWNSMIRMAAGAIRSALLCEKK